MLDTLSNKVWSLAKADFRQNLIVERNLLLLFFLIHIAFIGVIEESVWLQFNLKVIEYLSMDYNKRKCTVCVIEF